MTRLPYLDNLKVVLVAGVIAVHVAITYGMHGSWYLQSYDRVAAPLRDLLTAVGGVGWLFGLGLFFLISGWLSGPSLERKGPARFVRDRMLRLGIPLVLYTVLAAPVLEYVSGRADGRSLAFWPFVSHALWSFDPGPTWFLEALLAFSVAYALLRALLTRAHTRPASPMRLRGRDIAALAAVIATASFLIRLALPLGSEQFHLQLPVFPQYAVLFAFGAAAGRRGLLDSMPRELVGRCGKAALAAVAILPLLFLAGGFFSGSKHAFAGGFDWQALAAAAVEGTLAVCASLWFVDFFRRRVSRQGTFRRRLGASAYGAFLLHPPVIVGLALVVEALPVPASFKLLVVLVVGIAASFAAADLAMRLGPVSRVIGGGMARRRATVRLTAKEAEA